MEEGTIQQTSGFTLEPQTNLNFKLHLNRLSCLINHSLIQSSFTENERARNTHKPHEERSINVGCWATQNGKTWLISYLKLVAPRELGNRYLVGYLDATAARCAFDLHFFTALRAMAQAGLSLVVASKSPLIDIIGNNGQTSGFFNIFEQLIMKPFSTKAERFAQFKGTQAGLSDEERSRLLQFGRRGVEYWPLRLQLVGKMLLED